MFEEIGAVLGVSGVRLVVVLAEVVFDSYLLALCVRHVLGLLLDVLNDRVQVVPVFSGKKHVVSQCFLK